MALIWFEGFEGLGVTEGQANQDNIYDELRRTFAVITEGSTSRPYLRPGSLQGKALAFQNTNTFSPTSILYMLPNDLKGVEVVIGFRYKTSDLFTSGTSDIMLIWHETPSGTPQIRLRLDSSTNTVALFRGNTSLATSSGGVWTENTWHYYEVKLLIASGTGGSFNVRVDDTSVISGSSVNTLQDANIVAQMIQWNGYDSGGADDSDNEAQIDDIYVIDTTGSINNDFLGADTTVVFKAPTSDGTTNDFTPQTGVDNYAMVDENPASTTDYNDGATNGDIDEYGFDTVDQAGIYGVKIESHVQVDVEGRERTFRHRCRSGATVGNGADQAVVDDVNREELFEVDPNTSALWDKDDLNAAEFGVEVRD